MALASMSRLVVSVLLLLLQIAASKAGAAATAETNHQTELESDATNLFDFQHYQTLFHKHYNSQLETATRRLYFLANTIEIYALAVAYQFARSSHYDALNHLSDRSPLELDVMLNRVGARDEVASRRAFASGAVSSEAALTMMARELELGIELETGARAAPEPNPNLRRRKRDLTQTSVRLRPLRMSQLIQTGGHLPEPAGVLAKLERNPKSNNPNYNTEWPLELDTRGLVDQQDKLSLWQFAVSEIVEDDPSPEQADNGQRPADSNRFRVRSLLDKLKPWRLLGRGGKQDRRGPDSGPDEMFWDLRQSGCMFQPRDQGDCGACYAFAGITLAEFLVCKSTGKLVAFSEQYVLDCGTGRVTDLNGCDGADDSAMPHFIHNFGLELRARYPFRARVEKCPYPDQTNLTTTGFYRLPLDDYLLVPVRLWPQVLKETPIYVGIAPSKSFHRYGGGVYSGEGCSKRPDHAMLVVGHGRENGHEFWLLRNSFGTNWGQGGYYKLAKSAPKRCIEDQEGVVYGTRNGVDFATTAHLNEANSAAAAAAAAAAVKVVSL